MSILSYKNTINVKARRENAIETSTEIELIFKMPLSQAASV